MHYRKKTTIEAFHLPMGERPDWFLEAISAGTVVANDDGSYTIKTLEGDHRANPDDWIARGVAGELWPIKPAIFAASYEPADYTLADAGI